MARTRGPSCRGKGRGGCTAGSVTVPRRSSRIAKTVSGDQTAHVHHGEAHEASSSPPRCSHTNSPSSQGSPQHSSSADRGQESLNLSHSESAASPLPCSSPKSPVPPRQFEPFLPKRPPMSRPPFLLPTPVSSPLVSAQIFSRVSLFLSILLSTLLILSLY